MKKAFFCFILLFHACGIVGMEEPDFKKKATDIINERFPNLFTDILNKNGCLEEFIKFVEGLSEDLEQYRAFIGVLVRRAIEAPDSLAILEWLDQMTVELFQSNQIQIRQIRKSSVTFLKGAYKLGILNEGRQFLLATIAKMAAALGKLELLDWLINYGQKKGFNSKQLAKLILYGSSDFVETDDEGDLFFVATCYSRVEVLQWLLSHFPFFNHGPALSGAARYAALYGHANLLGWLIAHGADVNPRTLDRLLHRATVIDENEDDCAQANRIEIFEMLLARGASIDFQDENGCTPIECALKCIADFDEGIDKEPNSPLPLYEEIMWLILHGASPEKLFCDARFIPVGEPDPIDPRIHYGHRFSQNPLLYAIVRGETQEALNKLANFQGGVQGLRPAILLIIALQNEELLNHVLDTYPKIIRKMWYDIFEVVACTKNLALFRKVYLYLLEQLASAKEGGYLAFRNALERALYWAVLSRSRSIFDFIMERAIVYEEASDLRLSRVGAMVTAILRNSNGQRPQEEVTLLEYFRDTLRRVTYLQLRVGIYRLLPGSGGRNEFSNRLIAEALGRELPTEIAHNIMSFVLAPGNPPVPRTATISSETLIPSFNNARNVLDRAYQEISSPARKAIIAMILAMVIINFWPIGGWFSH